MKNWGPPEVRTGSFLMGCLGARCWECSLAQKAGWWVTCSREQKSICVFLSTKVSILTSLTWSPFLSGICGFRFWLLPIPILFALLDWRRWPLCCSLSCHSSPKFLQTKSWPPKMGQWITWWQKTRSGWNMSTGGWDAEGGVFPRVHCASAFVCLAAIAKYHLPGNLDYRRLFSPSWRSGCQHGWVLVRGLFLAYRKSPSCYVFERKKRVRGRERERERMSKLSGAPSYKVLTPSHHGDPTLVTSSTLNCLPTVSSLNNIVRALT